MQLLQLDDSQEEDFQNEENIESFSEYEDGSHYSAFIGEILINRYVLLEKIGKGNFSIVWLAKDFKINQNVALKIIKQEKKYYEQGLDEIAIMQHMQIYNENIIKFQNAFIHTSQKKNHLVLCFEILGISLFEIIQEIGQLDIEFVKLISKQILKGLDYLERKGIIHCDLKPQNILIQLSEEQMKELSLTDRYPQKKTQLEHIIRFQDTINFKIIDFGSSCFINKHFSNTIQTLNYRAPEVIVGCFYSNKVDIWSFGCIIYELVTGKQLFQHYDDTYESQLQILNQIYQYFGDFNDIIKYAGIYSKEYFDNQGQLIQLYEYKNMSFTKNIKQMIKPKNYDWIQNLLNIILDPNHLRRPNVGELIKFNIFDDRKYLKILKDYQQDDKEFENKKRNFKKLSNSKVKITSSQSLQQTYSNKNEEKQ
ncbi:hypothetical protein pb186bvf_006830 [Paramecium bursaria]